jgi:hypothetical protein
VPGTIPIASIVADSAAATGLKWAAPAGGGKVLQVVAATTITQTDTSSSTYQDSSLTATITPTLATSKILVLVNQNGLRKSSGSDQNTLKIQLLRGASKIAETFYINFTNTAVALSTGSCSFSILDEPATTSATTYKTQLASQAGTSDVGVQYNDSRSSIVLLEIGA